MNKIIAQRDTTLRTLGELFGRLGKGVSMEYGHSSICTTPMLDKTMHIIGSENTINIKTIAAFLMTTSGAATQHVAALEKLGLVERSVNKDDRREVNVIMTKRGRSAFTEIEKNSLVVMREVFKELSAKDLKTFTELLRKASKKYEMKEEI